MYKISIILIFSVILSGCSVFRPSLKEDPGISGKNGNVSLIQRLIQQNLTSENFHIQKAKIEIVTEGSKDEFLGSIKFLKPDTFLISLRSKSGIEAARIFLTSDTVLVNDRLNRELLYGKPGVLGSRYGISSEIFPIVFGDYVKGTNILDDEVKCEEGKSVVDNNIKGIKFLYYIDCQEGKVLSAKREGSRGNYNTELFFEKFVRINNVVYPNLIKIKYAEVIMNIEIEKIEIPWNGIIEFIPGNNFELKELI